MMLVDKYLVVGCSLVDLCVGIFNGFGLKGVLFVLGLVW